MAKEAAKARPYPGPFPVPAPELLEGAIGWRHTKERRSPTRSRRCGFEIVYPDGIEQFDLHGTRIRSSALWAA